MKVGIALTLATVSVFAADPVKSGTIESHLFILPSELDVEVNAAKPLTAPITSTAADITIRYLPSGIVVPTTRINHDQTRRAGQPDAFSFSIVSGSDTLPAKGDETYEIEVRNLALQGGGAPMTIRATGNIYSSANIGDLVTATKKATAPSTTTSEKDLFAGFNITVPSQTSATSGDFVFNHTIASLTGALSKQSLADSGSIGFALNTGSQDFADPRHFNIGFNLRKTILFASPSDLETLRAAVSGSAIPNSTALDAMHRVSGRFWRSLLIDYGFQAEGDVSPKGIGNVSNAIFDQKSQLGTPAYAFLNNQGFVTLRLMPAGFEVGHNITNPNDTTKEIGGVARYKAGAELALSYKAKTAATPIQRIELDAQSVYRRLFMNEVAYSATTKMDSNTASGSKLWTQVDFKIFAGPKIGNLMTGFKVSYQRGYLPPVFAQTKVFTYGIVFESDDKSK